MEIRRTRRARKLENSSLYKEVNITEVETPNQCYETLTNNNVDYRERLRENNLDSQMSAPSQISNEVQVWSQFLQLTNNQRIGRMRSKIENVSFSNPRGNRSIYKTRVIIQKKLRKLELEAIFRSDPNV